MKAANTRIVLLATVLLLLPGSLSFGQDGHPLYISICEIEHNKDTHSLEMTFKIFTEDLELALEELGAGKMRLGTDEEVPKANQFLDSYIMQNVLISGAEGSLDPVFLGKEVDMDVTWCYFEITGVGEVTSLSITNSLFFELFPEQTNIVHIKVGKTSKSLMLNSSEREGTVTF